MGGFNLPINSETVKVGVEQLGEVLKETITQGGKTSTEVVKQGGETIRSKQNNKTARYVSDNDTGVSHHKILIESQKNVLDAIIQGVDIASDAFAKINNSLSNRTKINNEHNEKIEKEETKRQEIAVKLKKAKNSFKIAMSKLETDSSAAMNAFNTGVDFYKDLWDKTFEIVTSDEGVDRDLRNQYFEQMRQAQENINKMVNTFLTRGNEQ